MPKPEKPKVIRTDAPTNTRRSFIDRYFWHALVSTVVLGGVVIALLWFAPRQARVQAVTLPSYPAGQVAAGRDLYAANCATCHGAQGQGYAKAGVSAPALNGQMHAWHHPDSQFATIMRQGIGQMPAAGASLSDKEVTAVLAYLKQWWEPEQLATQTQISQQNP